jgi:hypothetical protein
MRTTWPTFFLGCRCLTAVWVALSATLLRGDDFDAPPISYRERADRNAISRFGEQLAAGTLQLQADETSWHLRSALQELKVPISSQVLVFSKTSLQRHKIDPATPRAIYFSDDLYIGFCQNSPVLEISAVDPELGTVFYTLEMEDEAHPRLERQSDNCLICHASSHTRQVPGHMIRSVFTDRSGLPLLSMGSHRVDHTTPFANRWGGWYVTGTHGKQQHLGNLVLARATEPEDVQNEAGQNRTSLESLVDLRSFLSPHSDLVALMVLEHQAEGHNLITRASFQCRMALHQQQELNRELGQALDKPWDSTLSRIRSVTEDLLKYLLFVDEAPLTDRVAGTSSFAQEFEARGPRDQQGRSLREFDLSTRLFRYPCSYLVYTEAFQKLPAPVSELFWQRLDEILAGRDTTGKFTHLTATDRQAIREILIATHPQAAPWGEK